MSSVLLKNGFVHSPSDPFAESILIEDGIVAWIGSDDSATSFMQRADRVIDVDGALITPGFVDSHVHLLETALVEDAVDVSPCAGGNSAEQVIDMLGVRARAWQPGDGVICAHGYDDSAWTTASLTARDLESVCGNVPVYVPRADLHSAIITSSLAQLAGVHNGCDSDSGRVVGAAHEQVRVTIREIPDQERTRLYRTVLESCARKGIVAVHENAAPGIDTLAGVAELMAMTQSLESGLPEVIGYFGAVMESEEQARETLTQVPGLRGFAGDLSVDGSFGSRSAALHAPYNDDPNTSGVLHLSAHQIETHLQACSQAGVQAGFHVIGDRGLTEILDAAERVIARDTTMASAFRRLGHRLEHVELASPNAIQRLVQLGFSVSVQPAFDAHWGGPAGMYEQRLGVQRAHETTPLRDFLKAGIPMALGSDSPVTPIDPWGAVSAAVFHNNTEQRVSARAAFRAHTRGGWRVGGEANPLVGDIRLGSPAHLAVWRADALGVQAENDGRSSWTTDARSGSPLLPILDEKGTRPACVATLRSGFFLHDDLG
ncbi:amidohydrolase [Timonella sp. A28]|uniref:amidohydrolase n=1 Tax=Timonella sp. A28 TaxID=3442640 RepID=UPI003EBD74DC